MALPSHLEAAPNSRSVHRRVGLVGTPASVLAMQRNLEHASQPLNILGAILLHSVPKQDELGVKVLGTVDQLDLIVDVHRLQLVLISLPQVMRQVTEQLDARLNELGVDHRALLTVEDQLNADPAERPAGPVGSAFDITRLLNRPPHELDRQAIARTVAGRRVMITGAGGSIGSELAKLIAEYGPESLMLMERAENNLFEIDRWVQRTHPELPRHALLHDVVDAEQTLALCKTHQPQVIFHAAAHKHVPMMEDHPRQAVVNNFFGTQSIADAAAAVEAERFVMISTDKAVNPTSVMGATKRLAELYVQWLNRHHMTDFTMVRFGNVLGSACSVIPIWTQQLICGGPITVTDPRMTRYFMTIPEAAALVLQAAALDHADGQVLVLDMGRPIRIMDLAERFIQLQGLEPGRDVAIQVTGARPGEKLHEELAYEDEDMEPTSHRAVRIHRTTPPDDAAIKQILHRFQGLRRWGDPVSILRALAESLPEMQAVDVGPTPDHADHGLRNRSA